MVRPTSVFTVTGQKFDAKFYALSFSLPPARPSPNTSLAGCWTARPRRFRPLPPPTLTPPLPPSPPTGKRHTTFDLFYRSSTQFKKCALLFYFILFYFFTFRMHVKTAGSGSDLKRVRDHLKLRKVEVYISAVRTKARTSVRRCVASVPEKR